MPQALAIYITPSDESDLDWLRAKCVPVVENEVLENEERLDSEAVDVSWEYVDSEDRSDNEV